jgi:invasion protein IalB
MHRTIGHGALVLLLVSGVPASAQVLAPAQAPQLTTATYNDWTVRCEIHDTTKTCEMEQTSQMQGQPVSQIAIGRPSKTAPLRIVFQVPINVWLPAGVTFMLDDRDPGVSATFKRCVGNGCFADADLPAAMVSKLRTQTQNGKLLFKDAAQRVVTIPVSFKGFEPAFEAMAKE